MQTFALNALAESFEVDRSTMVRAMRNVPPDVVKRGNRPTWKTSTAARALEAHRAKMNGGGNIGGTDPARAALYARFDAADVEMRKLPTLEQRRAAAMRILAPLIAEQDRAIRAHGRAIGADPEVTAMRADHVYMLIMRGLEGPCQWTHDQAWGLIDMPK